MIAALLLPLFAQAPSKPETPDQVVTSFAHYLNRGEIREAVDRVQGGKLTYPAQRLGAIAKGYGRPLPLLNLQTVQPAKIEGDTATVSLRATVAGKEEAVVEEVSFRKTEGKWRIAPRMLDPRKEDAPPVNVWSLACTNGMTMLAILTPIWSIGSGSAVKTPSGKEMAQFASFTMMYAAAHDDTLPKDVDGLRSGLKPFFALAAPDALKALDELVKTREGITLRINPNLLGLSQWAVKQPEKTVLAYEEDAEGVAFRHDGKALFAFTDGMIRLVSKDESMKIFWLPD